MLSTVLGLFQFHKGTIKTLTEILNDLELLNFNSIKVRLKQLAPLSDNKLKTDIKNANRAIGDLKETEERFEELRLTGGEDTTIAEEVIDIINDDEYTEKKFTFFNDPDGLPLELYEK